VRLQLVRQVYEVVEHCLQRPLQRQPPEQRLLEPAVQQVPDPDDGEPQRELRE
jgi:hypothetical protein